MGYVVKDFRSRIRENSVRLGLRPKSHDFGYVEIAVDEMQGVGRARLLPSVPICLLQSVVKQELLAIESF